jgi:hypothetical protein
MNWFGRRKRHKDFVENIFADAGDHTLDGKQPSLIQIVRRYFISLIVNNSFNAETLCGLSVEASDCGCSQALMIFAGLLAESLF